MAKGSDQSNPANAIPVYIAGGSGNAAPPFGANSLGYQQILAATLATARQLDVPAGATAAYIVVDAGNVRWLNTGDAPTSTVGMPLYIGQSLSYEGDLSALSFIAISGSTPILNVIYYGVAP